MNGDLAVSKIFSALFVGPLCLVMAYANAHNTAYKYQLQLFVSGLQLGGLILTLLQPLASPLSAAVTYTTDPVSLSVLSPVTSLTLFNFFVFFFV